jgi:hypothetical protein
VLAYLDGRLNGRFCALDVAALAVFFAVVLVGMLVHPLFFADLNGPQVFDGEIGQLAELSEVLFGSAGFHVMQKLGCQCVPPQKVARTHRRRIPRFRLTYTPTEASSVA